MFITSFHTFGTNGHRFTCTLLGNIFATRVERVIVYPTSEYCNGLGFVKVGRGFLPFYVWVIGGQVFLWYTFTCLRGLQRPFHFLGPQRRPHTAEVRDQKS